MRRNKKKDWDAPVLMLMMGFLLIQSHTLYFEPCLDLQKSRLLLYFQPKFLLVH